jgi:hypothetical protein
MHQWKEMITAFVDRILKTVGAVCTWCIVQICILPEVRYSQQKIDDNTGRHQFPPYNAFDRFSLRIGSQTPNV